MGVNEVLDEINIERAQYLVNIDDLMYEMYCEPIFDKRAGIGHEAISASEVSAVPIADKAVIHALRKVMPV